MNAGGVPNTCKSNGTDRTEIRQSSRKFSGGRVSNAWGTCLIEGDNREKSLLIPHKPTVSHDTEGKDLSR